MTRKKSEATPADQVERSSAAEYLTFIAATGHETNSVDIRFEDENIWLTQKQMAAIYSVSVPTINHHLKQLLADHEIDTETSIRKFRIDVGDGRLFDAQHYDLRAVISVGFKVNSEQAVQFRKWANQIVNEYTIKGFAMDDQRLKTGGTILTKDYFEEQLQRVREIRLSERRFYQKITDIYATSLDYDAKAKATQRFFATVQNKLHAAVHGQTAAELIRDRANAEKAHMGLTNWTDAPDGKVQKFDVAVAKNYLTQDELEQLSRLVSAYLDLAEDMARRRIPMTMSDWETRLNGFLEMFDRKVLTDAGSISAELARDHAESEFEKFRANQDRDYVSDFDKFLQLPSERSGAES